MDTREILRRVASGEMSPEAALAALKTQPFEDLGYAKVDHHRSIRQGATEVIYGAGKTPEEILGIARAILEKGAERALITRMELESAAYLRDNGLPIIYDGRSRIGIAGSPPAPRGKSYVAVVTGGTSDIPVAEEAALTAEALGSRVERLYDVGVSGLHRLLVRLDLLVGAKAIVAIAGMEGALASVVGGLVESPVIAVPTSVGYGGNFGGLSALLSMLNSCASGVSVVNIDNGFGAGYLAHMINQIGGTET